MPNKKVDVIKRVYFDADVLISLISKTKGRFHIIEDLMNEAENGKIIIFTSQYSVAEVAFAEHEKPSGENPKPKIDKFIPDKINKLWHPDSIIKLVDVHHLITRNAKDLMRRVHPLSLKPPDAIHLATAKMMGVSDYFCYDDRLDKFAKKLGYHIKRPEIENLFPDPEEQI